MPVSLLPFLIDRLWHRPVLNMYTISYILLLSFLVNCKIIKKNSKQRNHCINVFISFLELVCLVYPEAQSINLSIHTLGEGMHNY